MSDGGMCSQMSLQNTIFAMVLNIFKYFLIGFILALLSNDNHLMGQGTSRDDERLEYLLPHKFIVWFCEKICGMRRASILPLGQ